MIIVDDGWLGGVIRCSGGGDSGESVEEEQFCSVGERGDFEGFCLQYG